MNKKVFLQIIDFFIENIDDSKKKSEALEILVQMNERYIGEYLINFIERKYINGIISREELKAITEKLKELQFEDFNYKKELNSKIEYLREKYTQEEELKQNHKDITEQFNALNSFLNKNNIDYYHTGGILTYFMTNTPLERFHHDMDIFINYRDLEKLEYLINNSNGQFSFVRDLGDRNDGKKSRFFKILYKQSNIPITIIMFERENDGSITQKDYFFDGNKLMCENEYNSSECAKLSFEDEKVYEKDGIRFKSISLEALFCSKKALGREKDKKDCEIIKKCIDIEKAQKLEQELTTQKKNETYQVKNNSVIDFICKNKENSKEL